MVTFDEKLSKAEDYCYAYRLNDSGMTDDEVKQIIKGLGFDDTRVKEAYDGSVKLNNGIVEDMDYAFTVKGICDYASGLAVFMDIVSMRELFGQEENYYNMLEIVL